MSSKIVPGTTLAFAGLMTCAVERAMPKKDGTPQTTPPVETAASSTFVRAGAQWDYAIQSGMTPDEAEAFLRSRGG